MPDLQSPDILQLGQFFMTFLVGATLALFFLAALGYLLLLWYRYRNREKHSLTYVFLQAALPRGNEVKIDAAEQMFSSLYSIKKGGWFSFLHPPVHITLEIVALPGDIRFYFSVPVKLKDLVEKQINGAYPDAEIKEVPEYNIFSEEGQVAYASLKLRNAAFNPIKVYKDLATDPLSLFTSALAKMTEGEGAAIQILISPAANEWRSSGKKFISKIRKQESEPDKAKFSMDAKTIEAIENKCSKSGFEIDIRIVVCSKDLEAAKANLSNIKSVFEQFSSDANGFKGRRIWFPALFMNDFQYRYPPVFRFGGHSILNSEELATIFHLPNKTIETPHVYWLNAKKAPAPANIASQGLYLGKSIYRGMEKPIFISDDDRRRHVYIVGKTGVGKTELLKDMLLQDIKAGRGLCLVDPHDLAEDLLQYIPPERAEDVIFFDPSDYERPMGMNFVEAYTEQQQHMVATSIINLMYKLYDPYKTGIIGPRFEHAIRNAILTVMCEPGSTFVEVMRCLQDSTFVQELLPKVQDPMVRRYWTDQIAQTSDFHKSEVLDYIVSKFGRFVTNKMIRNIIGQSRSSFDFRQVMDEGKILIINLGKGKIGEENSSFLGSILVPKILMAAMSRQDMPEPQRRDFYLYVDEFQNFATSDFAQILSEARKYRLNLTVANQFIGQIEEEIKNAIFGNVGTIVSFNIGVTDANFLQRWFTPVFSETDLMNIEAFNAYIKTIVNNEPVPPFSMNLKKDIEEQRKQANPRMAEIIKEMSRLRFGRDREEVEQEINIRARL
ncbi:MAG: type IV secretion system DNA-binding domain-containing protein [bacterium]|nr:type IV secretion system DNA-binding domain-containing protein [bacterium]